MGAYTGWKVNNKLLIGMGGYGLVNGKKGFADKDIVNKHNSFKMGYGGLMFEYELFSKKSIHATLNALAGGGYSNGYLNNDKSTDKVKWQEIGSAFFVVQPSFNVEVNITDRFRIGVGASYRYVKGSKLYGMDKYMSAPLPSLYLKFK